MSQRGRQHFLSFCFWWEFAAELAICIEHPFLSEFRRFSLDDAEAWSEGHKFSIFNCVKRVWIHQAQELAPHFNALVLVDFTQRHRYEVLMTTRDEER